MNVMYLVPVVAIVGAFLYSKWATANVRARAAKGEGAQMFHDSQASNFSTLAADERLIGIWRGQAYVAPKAGVGQIAGSIAKEAALNVVGFSSYTPLICVGLTTHGRLIISEEYSEGGKRGHYKDVASFPPGTHAVTGPRAHPEHQGSAPSHGLGNPLGLVRFIAPNGGDQYLGWLSDIGALTGAHSMVAIGSVLPVTPERAMAYWHAGSQPVAA
jgi:hypothetical protein